MENVFSGSISLSRVHPVGLILMLLSIILAAAAKPISKRFDRPEMVNPIKLVSVVLCCIGAAAAIL